ncbi:unnamed protein product [Meganyctiphanes norvegica]|uniref:HIG1 domain-containing protein n=1 Tax=Meganyctiphanes norvegica TaxID=48144 RepID=A0AAV2PNB5_MEGNR
MSQIAKYDESHSDRLARKAKDAPFMIVGLIGLAGVVGYGIYGFRNRQIKTSVYLIHMRVAGQGLVVSALTVGVAHKLFMEHVYPRYWPETPSIEEGKKHD